MPTATIEARILDLLQAMAPEQDFSASGHYVDDGLLDSFDLITLTTDLEAAFGIEIPGDQVLPEHFANLGTLAALVRRLATAADAVAP